MPEATTQRDIPLAIGRLIVSEAATWKGTPYREMGEASSKAQGGDCSGTTYKIYAAVNCLYKYRSAPAFESYAESSGLFRLLGAGELKQDGDILWWYHHMAIYSSFRSDPGDAKTERTGKGGTGRWTQANDMWTAHHTSGVPYGPAAVMYFRLGPPKHVYRYQK
jgi:cell wall-associated NlpC family hydrolase